VEAQRGKSDVSGTLREAGEFGLISLLAQTLGGAPGSHPAPGDQPAPGRALLLGIGDDAAAWEQAPATVVATTDMLVEGIHFDFALTGWRDLGWKALAVNLSDVAAMGAQAEWALVSLGLRPATSTADVAALYQGLRDLAAQAGCTVAGGDTVSVRADTVLNVVVLGSVPAGEAPTLLRRDRGRPGDIVAVTGSLGGSAGGLRALRAGLDSRAPGVAGLVETHRRPQPRLAAGWALRQAGVRCAMDISDGLLADLGRLCAASGCGADVQSSALPLHPALAHVFPDEAVALAAGGGEDYELLVAAPPDVLAAARAALAGSGLALTAVGRLTGEPGVRLRDDAGRELALPHRGWDHFPC
jgi:thiamine-monophosphate kinase